MIHPTKRKYFYLSNIYYLKTNFIINYCGKITFKVIHIFREGNACADKLANLGFIHREFFHWYNRLSSSMFLEFFISRYSLPMYRFC